MDTLFAVCTQALGSLETRAYDLTTPRRSRRPVDALPDGARRHAGVFIATATATIVGDIVVAWAAFRFGWVG